ncbi:nucleoside diphosphate kinase 7 [Pelomyxa schiedti]|nr:nucleoside diphosphate kinase 7 [Pelomyxa schiedti]
MNEPRRSTATAAATDERYVFNCEWMDPFAGTALPLLACFFPQDGTIELVNMKQHRLFLKRTSAQGLTLRNFVIGSHITVYNRSLLLLSYGDDFTRHMLEADRQKTLVLLNATLLDSDLGAALSFLKGSKIQLTHAQMLRILLEDAYLFDQIHGNDWLSNASTDCAIIALELTGENAVQCAWQAVDSINTLKPSAAICAQSADTVDLELDFFFGDEHIFVEPALCDRTTTLGVIKPHCVMSGQYGKVVSSISRFGFNITAMRLVQLTSVQCQEFLEVYKGVIHNFQEVVAEMISGPCIALELSHPEATPEHPAQSIFRGICGPHDPLIARNIRPETLRATFGVNAVKNAVHCTDLPEDSQLDLEYFFKILTDL